MSSTSRVIFYPGNDPEMFRASLTARETFRYFWYQQALDFNRIVPALERSCLKIAFSDDFSDPDSPVEHMWVDSVNFDGVEIDGILISSPNWLKSVREGETVSFPLEQLGDWICVLDGIVYGSYTIQVLRSRMNERERRQHDNAWRLSFPALGTTILPDLNEKFEEVIANLTTDEIAKNPAIVEERFENGRTLLHLESLYGRVSVVKVILDGGGSPTTLCNRGWTASEYAKSLNWKEVLALLKQAV